MEIKTISNEILEKILNIADAGAVIVTESNSYQTRFSQNKIDIVKSWRETTIEIMLDKDQKVVVQSYSYPALENIDKIVEMSKIALEKSPPRPIYAPLPEPSVKFESIPNKIDKEIIEKPEKMVDISKTAIDSALTEGIKRVAGAMRANHIKIALSTSSGAQLEDEYTNTYLDVRAFENGTITGHASQISRSFKGINPGKLGSEAAIIAKLSVDPKPLNPGRYDTIITPNAVASLFNFVGGSTSAFAVLMGFSFFTQQQGKEVAAPQLKIIDDPTGPESARPRIFDDEGIATRKNILIEDGILKTYLHNRFTAKAFNSELTGNAGWISPRPWYIKVEPGEHSKDELIEELSEGLIVNNITYVRFQNYVKGDFSGIIRDGLLYVKNGEIVHAVKGLRFSDNMLRILKNIKAIGKEPENIFHWWLEQNTPVHTSSILVEKCGYTKAHG